MPDIPTPARSRLPDQVFTHGRTIATLAGIVLLASACQVPPRSAENISPNQDSQDIEAQSEPQHDAAEGASRELIAAAESSDTDIDRGRDELIMAVSDNAMMIPASSGDVVLASSENGELAELAELAEQSEQKEPGDVLDRIRAGYQFTDDSSDLIQARKRIAQQFNWYQRHPDYMNRVFRRSEPYLFHIVESLEARGMPAELALLPIVESAFDPFAYSHGRAAGLWQFIPATGKHYGLKQNWWYDGRRDVTESTRAALDYLETLANMFDGDYLLAVAAYNSGEGVVRRSVRRNKRAGKPTDFWHLKLPPETRAYVPKLLALRELIRDPAAYDLSLPSVADQPYFEAVTTDGQIDMALAADLADIDLDELYSLNPGFNRWATDPDGPHQLLVPIANAPGLIEALRTLPPTERVRWQRHRIRTGDNLGAIARKYGTTVELIKDVNNLRGTNIRAGSDLMIPSARKSLADYSKSESSRLAKIKQTPRGGSRTTYVVRPGDSFWEISRAHGVGVRQLASWNGMSPRDTLSVGRELVIWGGTSRQASRKIGTSVTPPGDRTTRRISYTVRRGDSFARISGRFRVSVAQLQKWNKAAARQKYLRPGQKLTVYVDVTRQTG